MKAILIIGGRSWQGMVVAAVKMFWYSERDDASDDNSEDGNHTGDGDDEESYCGCRRRTGGIQLQQSVVDVGVERYAKIRSPNSKAWRSAKSDISSSSGRSTPPSLYVSSVAIVRIPLFLFGGRRHINWIQE
mmetsp:Transcript_28527/g.33822  ORF Transcript_28527/g.33822 Transcript_28527/m.33822 type:complete len:132 (-) Transcript_28527:5-400(-)